MISVAMIEDHQVLVDAFELILRTNPEFRFAGSAGTLAAGRSLIIRTRPDVLLLDVGLPDGEGLDLVPEAQRTVSNMQIVVLTRLNDDATIMRAINLGVTGFLQKSCPLEDLLKTIRQAAQGEMIMPTNLLLGLLKRVPNRQSHVHERAGNIWENLTTREKEILSLLARGESANTIAEDLCIAPLTVRTHIRNIMSKLGVHSRLEAVTFALRLGLIEHPILSYS
jgi:DNA-binding NarL/FixJ family response regulator